MLACTGITSVFLAASCKGDRSGGIERTLSERTGDLHCFFFFCFSVYTFYGAKTASVWCLNVRQLSEMFDLAISLPEAFRESPDNQPSGLHNVRFFFQRFGGVCSRSSSFDSATWVSSTSWISATSESGNPSGILWRFLCLRTGWRIHIGTSAGHCFIPQSFIAVNFSSYIHCFVFNT